MGRSHDLIYVLMEFCNMILKNPYIFFSLYAHHNKNRFNICTLYNDSLKIYKTMSSDGHIYYNQDSASFVFRQKSYLF
jgi:hypothetical protein